MYSPPSDSHHDLFPWQQTFNFWNPTKVNVVKMLVNIQQTLIELPIKNNWIIAIELKYKSTW